MLSLKNMSKFLTLGGICLAGLIGCSQADNAKTNAQATDNKTVAITAIVEHPALDAVRKGVIDELAAQGYKENQNLKINFQSAQGNTATAGQIAKQFVGDNPDVIVAISTPSAQSVVASTNSIPVVYAAVTDPVEAKLVKSWDASGTNVTGVSDQLPLDSQIELIKKVIPNVKNIGYVYSPSEINSAIVLKELEAKLKPMNINIIAAPAQRTVDIPQATRSLQGKVDVIYTSLDNNVVSAYESLAQAAREIKIPAIGSNPDLIERGAVAVLGVNYENLGRETGKVVSQILKGESTGNIKSATMQQFDLYLNPENAAAVGLTFSEELVKQAHTVVPAK